ncbi:hypothetical protein VZT92_017307 [Zoarces viviparus]|uniref:B30.2/SPRY domain-containing protein n=1 Tax=Zoarces viviparus TaxID=48416 RepID=A0AAW1ESF1_ZOAVI
MSLQKCHCGWSKETTYQGLRIHQGEMGCMPKGQRIPKEEQSFWRYRVKGVDQGKHQPAKTGAVNMQREPLPPRPSSPTTAAEIKLEYEPEVVRPRENDRRAQTLPEGNFEAELLEISNVFSDVMRIAEDAEPKSPNRPFSKLRTTTSTKLAATELERISNFAVDVELDPTTAYKCLVSADGKILTGRGGTQRFGSVLGLNRMTSGKSYWEVVVSNKTGWSLGVATGDAQRKGKLLLCPDNGYWVVEHSKNKFAALTNPPVGLPLKEKPQKVGVFVDYEEGLVSFYDVTAQSHIYSFTECAFTEGIYPYFIVHVIEDGSADSLIISTVKRQ